MKDHFSDLIGQESAKRKLEFYIDSFQTNKLVPHLMFVAPRGNGKTTLAQHFADSLKEYDPERKTLMINCSGLKNIKQFFVQIVVPHIMDKNVTVVFDEASEIPRDVTMALLTILNPNPAHKNTFVYDDSVVDFDFRKVSFIFATTEAQSIFHALMDRCERIDLEEYSIEQLGQIIKRNVAKGLKIEKEALAAAASALRGNARKAQQMAEKITAYAQSRKIDSFTMDDWNSLCHTLDILPLGLTRLELQILKILSQNKDVTLTRLSAITGLSRESLQRELELFLSKHGLISIQPALGRNITSKGQNYLKENKL